MVSPDVIGKLCVLGPLFAYWVLCAWWAWRQDNTDRFQLDAAIKEEEELAAETTGKKKGVTQWIVISAILAYEFWQLLTFTWSPDTPWSFAFVKEIFQALAFFLTGNLFLIFFWLQLMLYIFGAFVFLVTQYRNIHDWVWTKKHEYQVAKRKKRLAGLRYIAPERINQMHVKKKPPALGPKLEKRINYITKYIAPWTGQFLYEFFFIPALKWCLEIYDCNYNIDPPGLNQAPELECWTGAHFGYATAALLQILFIYPVALLWMLKKNEISADWIYLPRFDISLTVTMFYLCAVTTYLSHIQILISLSLIVTMGLLLVVNYQLQPCLGVGAVTNHWRTATFIGAWWSAFMALVTVLVNDTSNHGTSIAFFVLVIPVMVCGYYISKRKARIMDQETIERIRNITAESSRPMMLKVAKDMVIMTLTEEKRTQIIQEGALARLLVLLSVDDAEILSPASQVLANCMSDSHHVQAIEDAGIIEWMVKRLSYAESAEVRSRAARASQYYLKHQGEAGVKKFKEYDGVSSLCKLISDKDNGVVLRGLKALTTLAEHKEEAHELAHRTPSVLMNLSVMMRLSDSQEAVCAATKLLLPILQHGDERVRDEFERDGLMAMCCQLLGEDYTEETSLGALACLRYAFETEPVEYVPPVSDTKDKDVPLSKTRGASNTSLDKSGTSTSLHRTSRALTVSGGRTLKSSTSDHGITGSGGHERRKSMVSSTSFHSIKDIDATDPVSLRERRKLSRALSISSNKGAYASGGDWGASSPLSARSNGSELSELDNSHRHLLRKGPIAREILEPLIRTINHHGSDRSSLQKPAQEFYDLLDAPNLCNVGPSLMSAFVDGHASLQIYVAKFLINQLDTGISSPDEYSQQDKDNLADFVKHEKGDVKTVCTQLLYRLDLDSYSEAEALAVFKECKEPLVRLMALRSLAKHSAARPEEGSDQPGAQNHTPVSKDTIELILKETKAIVTGNMTYTMDLLAHDVVGRLVLSNYETTSCLNMLAQPPALMAVPAMRTLTRKMYDSNDERLKCQKYSLLAKLKPLLKTSDAVIQKEACRCLANYVLNKDILQSVVKDGVLDYLLPLLQRADTPTQRTVLNIIANLGGTLESRKAILESGYIEIALSLLIMNSDLASIKHICRGLGNLCISPDTRKKAQPLIEPQLVSFIHLWTYANPTDDQKQIQGIALKALQKVNQKNPLLEKHGVEKLAKRKLYNDASAAIESGKAFVERPRVIHIFRNGDRFHEGQKVVLNKNITSFSALCDLLTKQLRLSTGPVRTLYKHNMRYKVTRLEHIIDGHVYIAAAGGEKASQKVSQRFQLLCRDLPEAQPNAPSPVPDVASPTDVTGDRNLVSPTEGMAHAADGTSTSIGETLPLPGSVASSPGVGVTGGGRQGYSKVRAKTMSAVEKVKVVNRMRSVSGSSSKAGTPTTQRNTDSSPTGKADTTTTTATTTTGAGAGAQEESTPLLAQGSTSQPKLAPLTTTTPNNNTAPLPGAAKPLPPTTTTSTTPVGATETTDSLISLKEAPFVKPLAQRPAPLTTQLSQAPGTPVRDATPTAFNQGPRSAASPPTGVTATRAKPGGAGTGLVSGSQPGTAAKTSPGKGKGKGKGSGRGSSITSTPNTPGTLGRGKGRGRALAPIAGTQQRRIGNVNTPPKPRSAVTSGKGRGSTTTTTTPVGRGRGTATGKGKGKGKGKVIGGGRGRGR